MRMQFATSRFHRLLRDERGVSGIELALFAPFLILAILLMIDFGLEISLRMELGRSVRAGAQAAINRNDSAAGIAEVVRVTAGSPTDLRVNVATACSCAGATSSCSTVCGSGEVPSVFIDIDSRRPFAGLLRGERVLEAATRVQIR